MDTLAHSYEMEMLDAAFIILYDARHCKITDSDETKPANRAEHIITLMAFEYEMPINDVIADIRTTTAAFDIDAIDKIVNKAITGMLH